MLTTLQGSPSLLQRVASLSPVAWYRYGIGLTDAGGGACSSWADQSGNGRALLQAVGANQPSLQSDNSILCDSTATARYMKATFTFSQPITVYALVSPVTTATNRRFIDGGGVNAGATFRNTGGNVGVNAGLTIGNIAFPLSTYSVIAYELNGASSLVQRNGGVATSGDAGADNPGGVTIGCDFAAATTGNAVLFKELILFSAAHDAATRAIVITYLAAVGGLNI